jgi:hypothetical protein
MAIRGHRREGRPELRGAAIICSAHVNAIGIALSLREAGWRGPIICLDINGGGSLARRWPKLCECWEVTLAEPSDIFDALADRLPLDEVGAVFFTDERFLPAFADRAAARLPGARFRIGTERHLEDVLDRRRFYQFVAERGLASVPATVPSSEDPVATFGKVFHIRVWLSWSGMKKLPRGCSIRGEDDLRAWSALCEREGLGPEEWGYQELLSTHPQHNISVCGWHDPDFSYYVVTRKIHASNQIGWLVELAGDFPELDEQTRAILTAMDYSGPFEMEFLLDPGTGEYKVIELNPRFWMQHRLTASVSRNCLVRRYLGLDVGQRGRRSPPPKRFWIDTEEALERLGSRTGYTLVAYLPRAVWSCPVRGSVAPVLNAKLAGLLRLRR